MDCQIVEIRRGGNASRQTFTAVSAGRFMLYTLCLLSLLTTACTQAAAEPAALAPAHPANPVTTTQAAASDPLAWEAVEDGESWQVLAMQGQRIGHAHSITTAIIENGQQVRIRSQLTSQMSLKRFGQTIVSHTLMETTELASGELQSYRFEQRSANGKPTITVGTVSHGEMTIETTVDGRTQTQKRPHDPELRTPHYFDRLFHDKPLRADDVVTLRLFSPEIGQPTTATVKVVGRESAKLWDGSNAELLRVQITQDKLPGVTIDAWLNASGSSRREQTKMLGLTMDAYQTTREVALEAIPDVELDLALSTLVHTNKAAGLHERAKRVVLLIECEGGIRDWNFEGQWNVAAVAVGAKKQDLQLTITPAKLPATAKVGQIDEEYTQPTSLLQSDDPLVRKLTREAIGQATDPAQQAAALERFVFRHVSKKNFSSAMASAGEVAREKSGDCTEHAMLLAAMLRAAGIPSRAAIGLVYVESESAYGPHMWTEAWLNDRWHPLDATLAMGGIGCGHLKLGDSSFNNDALVPAALFAPLMGRLGQLHITIKAVEFGP